MQAGGHRACRHAPASSHARQRPVAGRTPLAQIAPILRHASVATTSIYAKVDRDAAAGPRAPVAAGGRRGMSELRDRAEDYLRMRRALGYKLEVRGLLLLGFVS
jgi:hypothetical protein